MQMQIWSSSTRDETPSLPPANRDTKLHASSTQLTSLNFDDFSHSPLAMSCENFGLEVYMIFHLRETCKETVARRVEEWYDAPCVLSLFHPSPEFTRASLTLLVAFL